MEGLALDWRLIVDHLARAVFAFALALPLGWERERGSANAGLRTFPIVATAACGYALIARGMAGATTESEARVLQGLLTGIGFVGGGAILKEGGTVRGVVTAASVWNTGAIGAAVAYGREEIAIVLSAANFLVLFFFPSSRPNGEDE